MCQSWSTGRLLNRENLSAPGDVLPEVNNTQSCDYSGKPSTDCRRESLPIFNYNPLEIWPCVNQRQLTSTPQTADAPMWVKGTDLVIGLIKYFNMQFYLMTSLNSTNSSVMIYALMISQN